MLVHVHVTLPSTSPAAANPQRHHHGTLPVTPDPSTFCHRMASPTRACHLTLSSSFLPCLQWPVHVACSIIAASDVIVVLLLHVKISARSPMSAPLRPPPQSRHRSGLPNSSSMTTPTIINIHITYMARCHHGQGCCSMCTNSSPPPTLPGPPLHTSTMPRSSLTAPAPAHVAQACTRPHRPPPPHTHPPSTIIATLSILGPCPHFYFQVSHLSATTHPRAPPAPPPPRHPANFDVIAPPPRSWDTDPPLHLSRESCPPQQHHHLLHITTTPPPPPPPPWSCVRRSAAAR